jgi:hypothetical protein
MTTQTTYTCDGCGKERRGSAKLESMVDGRDSLPEDWSDLRLQDFGNPMRAYHRHYCPGCTKRMLEIINNSLPQGEK